NRLEEAAECCRRAILLKADFADAHNTLGTILEQQEKFDEATVSCRRAIELNPSLAEAWGNLGILLSHQGRVAEARACFERSQQFFPQSDVWKLNILSLCPIVFGSNAE